MRNGSNHIVTALASGAIGASTLTLLHESVRRVRSDAPRMDVLGMRAIARGLRAAEAKVPEEDPLHTITMAGDLVANGLYYSLVGAGTTKRVWLRGVLLGLTAGIGGVLLPPLLGLGSKPSARTWPTKVMTVSWYLVGGVAAAAASRALSKTPRE